MSRAPEVAEIVQALIGTWSGQGSGDYPTIEAFTYREETLFTEREDHPALHYEQRTWRHTPEGEVVSHWETGLLRISRDGTASILNAQGGRTEVMDGSWARTGDGWRLDFAGTGFAGDDRVVNSRRSFRLEPGSLSYIMAMETTATGEMFEHLEATLGRDV